MSVQAGHGGVRAIRWGSRARAGGQGIPVQRGRRATNLQFGSRVVTIQARGGILTPSSIILDLPQIPVIRRARFNGESMETDAFRAELGSPESLRLAWQGPIDHGTLFEELAPYVRPSRGSIAGAVLNRLYGLEWSCSGLERAIHRRQVRVLRKSTSPAELAKGLLGLGYGLTPSGDDLLLGLIGIYYLQGLDLSELRQVIGRYENPFSRTILCDALEGHYPEPVLVLLRHFTRRDCPEKAVEAVLGMGSTSGKDVVAGMLYGVYLSGPQGAGPG
jgi:hypothetical protein